MVTLNLFETGLIVELVVLFVYCTSCRNVFFGVGIAMRPAKLCPRCGSSKYAELDYFVRKCLDCGLIWGIVIKAMGKGV
jgi:rRNA maturation endonuclease Nob1